ncbi:MAG: DUF4494 domain-containing protein [Bacteroidaceae bacterium]|nr:DUF4494 domain-containing protein [Bacteroidaceae bacterium]
MKPIFFECKVKYMKVMENGLQKPATEAYLVYALSYTEAESRFLEKIRPFMYGVFEVDSITRVRISDIFFNDKESADKWYKCKLSFIAVDEKNGAEKRNNAFFFVQASDLREAIKYLDEQMKGTVCDYEIIAVTETLIMDVYPYEEDKQ